MCDVGHSFATEANPQVPGQTTCLNVYNGEIPRFISFDRERDDKAMDFGIFWVLTVVTILDTAKSDLWF